MILVFPTVGDVSGVKKEKGGDSIFIRSFNKNRFNALVQRKVEVGWVVHQMTSSFRRTPFGSIVTYFCELRRGSKEG
jgi:hypothetical protein